MTALLIGLLGFLAIHSIRIVAPRWREARIAAMGELAWKGVYSLLSIAFFVLLVWGYGQARQHTQLLWLPPMALRHVGALLVAIAFVLVAAASVLSGLGLPDLVVGFLALTFFMGAFAPLWFAERRERTAPGLRVVDVIPAGQG